MNDGLDDEEREALEMTTDELLEQSKRGRPANLVRNIYFYVDYLAFGDQGEVTDFTWGEARARRPRWQRYLALVVPSWRTDTVLRRYTNPFDLPIWVRGQSEI